MGRDTEDLPGQMSLVMLEERCQHEMKKFGGEEPSTDRYCLEIFYRALINQDEQAWNVVVRSFRRLMKAWLHRHPCQDTALRYDSEENYIDSAFSRFWQATSRNQNLDFQSMRSVLFYLKACVDGAVRDTIRAHSRPVLRLPEPGADFSFEEPVAEEHDESIDLWDAITSILPSRQEKRVAFLIIYCGLKPRQVIEQCPGEFKDVYEIYRIYRNVEERLRRNADRLRWRLTSEGK
ncbi:hypothetical protein KSF_100180 [Reticulibacter mediterranei]|uniref:Uncharacterized protein n=1 Tax=Reticulibacter mediterranei TaxID=2778369 RepID=A0A8J3N8W6_9CHLR|nr:hypothetical protein [Reticulibacter mediterranei]GHO99970.1 hypothetical protein KSF_100180 [Reticulibacter mediterranei]